MSDRTRSFYHIEAKAGSSGRTEAVLSDFELKSDSKAQAFKYGVTVPPDWKCYIPKLKNLGLFFNVGNSVWEKSRY